MKIIYLLIYLFQLVSFSETLKEETKENLRLAESIISNPNHIDTLIEKGNKVKSEFSGWAKLCKYNEFLIPDINKSKLKGSYYYFNDTLYSYGDGIKIQAIRFKNKVTKEVLTFFFNKEKLDKWKLMMISFVYHEIIEYDKSLCKKISESILKNPLILKNIVSDTNQVTKNFKITYNNQTNRMENKIVEKRFSKGFDFRKDTLEAWFHLHYNYYSYGIKYKNFDKNAIIWFYFNNYEKGIWKLSDINFCNNSREMAPDLDIPCDEE